MVHHARASHIGSCLSMADVLAVLYADVLRVDPARAKWPERDRFVLSKGHAAAILYAVLAERGFFPAALLETYCDDDSILTGHISCRVPGVEVSSGSLGHGLPIACGMAMAASRAGRTWRTYALLSDGEMDEGSNWEAALFAGHHGLDNLLAVVDRNRLQGFGACEAVLDLEPLAEKWRAFRWGVREIDGHDHDEARAAFAEAPFRRGRPSVIIARTVKGKGVSFMENELAWHYRSPDDGQLARALAELEVGR
jgi:transketolase